MTVKLPDIIEQAMLAQDPPWLPANPNTLAVKCGLDRMTTYRLFNGTTQHVALSKAVKIADALEMSIDEFFHVAMTLEPALIGDLIKGRLKRLGKTNYIFAKEISDGNDGGIALYTTGGVKYERLHIYYTISKALNIPLARLCETMLMIDPIVTSAETATLIRRSGVRFSSI